ncbi:MAG: hypothetical protein RLP44_22250, partial [Aggregatilineales bacterium]
NPAEAGYSSRIFVKTAHFSGVLKIILALGFQPNAVFTSDFITLQLSRGDLLGRPFSRCWLQTKSPLAISECLRP